jgi:uncharacterized peroxidase-related enzyme
MSWVPLVSAEEATPDVKRIYDNIRERSGFVPNYFLVLGCDVQLLQNQANLFTNAMYDDRGLPRLIKEQVALVVSGLNSSTYCVAAHMEILGSLGIERAVIRKLTRDYTSAPVESNVMELFRFAEKLTRHPAEINKGDVDRLREAGWNDRAILDTVLVTSLYNCANRFSGGLGLLADFQ